MDTTTYTTRDEAIYREITEPLEASVENPRDAYDIDAIADEVLGDHRQGYAVQVGTEQFWAIAERHAR